MIKDPNPAQLSGFREHAACARTLPWHPDPSPRGSRGPRPSSSLPHRAGLHPPCGQEGPLCAPSSTSGASPPGRPPPRSQLVLPTVQSCSWLDLPTPPGRRPPSMAPGLHVWSACPSVASCRLLRLWTVCFFSPTPIPPVLPMSLAAFYLLMKVRSSATEPNRSLSPKSGANRPSLNCYRFVMLFKDYLKALWPSFSHGDSSGPSAFGWPCRHNM